MESIELKLGIPDVGFTDAVTPFGTPEIVKATLWEVPDDKVTVIVDVALPPSVMVCAVGDAEIEKSNICGACTARRALVWCIIPFAEPVRVIV
jgi:hypothetical protein